MAKRRPARLSAAPLTQWQKFSTEFPDSELLSRELLYALPEQLIYAVHEQAPEVLSPEDVGFELRLRRLSATGFYREQTMFSDVLDGHFENDEEFDAESVEDWRSRSEKSRDTRFREILSTDELGSVAAGHRQRSRNDLEEKVRARMRGFAGWLVTHPAYWRDVHSIEVADGEVLQKHGVFPPLDQHFGVAFRTGSPLENDVGAALGHLALLRTRWCLQSYTTFQIPEPLRPELMVGDQVTRSTIQQDGVGLFLPWPLLADSSFGIQDLYEYHRRKTDLSHLDDWLRDSTKLSYKRCGQLMDLYVYRECAIRNRYGERLKGHTEALDRAFFAYWRDRDSDSDTVESGMESVRKLRGILRQRLELCRRAVDERDDELRRDSGSPARQGPAETMLAVPPVPHGAAPSESAKGRPALRSSRTRRAKS